jgi:hypothetical protein
MSKTSFSFNMHAAKQVRFSKHTSQMRPPNDDEIFQLRNFEFHARSCCYCGYPRERAYWSLPLFVRQVPRGTHRQTYHHASESIHQYEVNFGRSPRCRDTKISLLLPRADWDNVIVHWVHALHAKSFCAVEDTTECWSFRLDLGSHYQEGCQILLQDLVYNFIRPLKHC